MDQNQGPATVDGPRSVDERAEQVAAGIGETGERRFS